MKSRIIPRINNILKSFFLFWVVAVHANDYSAHEVSLHGPSDLIESNLTCNHHQDPKLKRCIFNNVIAFNGKIFVVAEGNLSIPQILCSAVDVGYTQKICPFIIGSKQAIYDTIRDPFKNKTVVGINTESAIHFAQLNGDNAYHSIFEALIPVFEIIKSDAILSKWLGKNNNDTIKLMHFTPFAFGNAYNVKFFRRFFPHIDYTHGQTDWHSPRQQGNNTRIYLVKYLLAGSNHSCVHYYHCSRTDFQTPLIAGEFRDYILHKVGINSHYRKTYVVKTYPNNTLNLIAKENLNNHNKTSKKSNNHGHKSNPRVVIVQRTGSRKIANLEELISIIQKETGKKPSIVNFEKESIDKQITISFKTDILIMVHGGGIVNSFYLPPYATLIEIYPFGFPYHLNGLVNWMRYALRDIPIAHAPFDIIDPTHSYFAGNRSLPLCITTDLWSVPWRLFWSVENIYVDTHTFENHFKNELAKWNSRTNYIPSLTKIDFLKFSRSYKELWYNNIIRARNPNKNISLPNCSYILDLYNVRKY